MYISLLSVAHVILAVLLILIVLIQRSETGMGALGGSNAVFTGKSVSNILTKATTIIAILFMIVSLLLVRDSYQNDRSVSVIEEIQLDDSVEQPAKEPIE